MRLPKKPQKGLVTLGAMGKDGGGRDKASEGQDCVSSLFSSLFPFLPSSLFCSSILSLFLSSFPPVCPSLSFFLPFFLPVTGCHYVTTPGLELTTPYVDRLWTPNSQNYACFCPQVLAPCLALGLSSGRGQGLSYQEASGEMLL